MKKGLLILASILFLLPVEIRAEEPLPVEESFFAWQDKVTELAHAAIKGDADALHNLFLMSVGTDGGMVDTMGEACLDVKKKQPKLFKKVLKKEDKKVRDSVQWQMKAAR